MSLSTFFDEVVEGMMSGKAEELLTQVLPVLKQKGFVAKELEETIEPEELANILREHSTDKIFTFDCECIEDNDDYAALLMGFIERANLADKITGVESQLRDNTAVLQCNIGETLIKSEWIQKDDWVAAEFSDFIKKVFEENFDLKFVSLPAEDQCAEFILLDLANGKVLSEFFDCVAGNHDPDEVSGYKIILTIIASVIGVILTTLIGWFFTGFWISLGISLVFWLLLTIFIAFRIVNKQEQHAALEKELQENPELVGKLVVEMMNELKSKK